MDRKNKVWLIVLIVLLILAVTGMVVSRNQLAGKQAEYDAVSAQLTEAQDASAALKAEVAQLTDSLAAEQEKVAELESSAGAAAESAAAELEAQIAGLEEALAAAETKVAELSAAEPTEATETPVESTEAPAEPAKVVLAETVEWRAAPGEDAQALTSLNAGETLNSMNQAATDNLGAEWICVEMNGQTGWIPASAVKTADAAEQVAAIMDSDASDEEKLAEMQALEAELVRMISDLEAQRDTVTAAEEALAAKQVELDAANEAIAALEVQISEMTAQTESEVAARAKLETQLASAHDEAAAIAAELDAARAEYEKHVGELEAYMLSRELIDGEAHIATTSASEITVAADGVTAVCSYTNTSVSGNAVVLTIVSGEKELYRSAPIAPGESVAEVTLTEALAAGEHEAIAVTTVYNEDGTVQLESRVPVTLKVAE